MRIKVLGCNGSITGDLRTTCYQVDEDVLIDAGTGAGDLDLDQAVRINTVFLTHAHLDHCALLPMLADAASNFRDVPLTVYALSETITTLRENMFNGRLWPDYTVQPSAERPYIRFLPIAAGVTIVSGHRRFTALPAHHSIPCVGYNVDNGAASWAYSGDSTLCPEFWQALSSIGNLRHLLVETTFLNADSDAAVRSGHMTAQLLIQGLRQLRNPAVEIHIVHTEAGREEAALREVLEAAAEFQPSLLHRGTIFELPMIDLNRIQQ